MTGIGEMLNDTNFRSPIILCAAAALAWAVFLALALAAVRSSGLIARSEISSSARVLDNAMQFRALPRKNAAAPGDPLGALSNLVGALNLRDRMQQLQSNPSGIVIQFERLYGDELGGLINSVENSGLTIKTAEIRALPSENGRALNAVFTMEAAR